MCKKIKNIFLAHLIRNVSKHTGIRLTKWLASRNGQFHIFVNNSFLNTNLGGFVVTI